MKSITIALAAACALPLAAGAQQRAAAPVSLSLQDAIGIAVRESEALRIARAASERAEGQQYQARSQRLPQLNGTASYQRAVQSQFAEISKRVPSNDTSSSSGSGNSFANSPLARVFASPNTIVLGLTASQTLYTGGRVSAGIAASDAGRRAADLAVKSAHAQLSYDVATAYYDAVVAQKLAAIADSSLAQTERALRQTQLAHDVGNTADYDLLRARVQRDNARPTVVSAHAQQDIALLHLRQMLNLPPNQPLTLTTGLDSATVTPMPEGMAWRPDLVLPNPDLKPTERAVVQEAAENVRVIEAQLQTVRAARLPAVSLSSTYQRFGYPPSGHLFEDQWRLYFPNWTVSLGVSMPLLTGGRQHGDQMVAEANLAEARARYDQVREATDLDTRVALAQLQEAESAFSASTGTDEQAAKAYSIAEVRFSEGVASQLELTQARVDLETARARRIQASRDLALARYRWTLLVVLPLSTTAQR